MQSEAEVTGLDWNGIGVMGNKTLEQSTVDGRIVLYGWENKPCEWAPYKYYIRVWVNAGEDAAKMTPADVDEIGCDYISDPEAGVARGWCYHTKMHYDLTYIGEAHSWAEACKMAERAYADHADEWED